MASIHPTAVVAPGAQIHPSCEIGPYAVIGNEVVAQHLHQPLARGHEHAVGGAQHAAVQLAHGRPYALAGAVLARHFLPLGGVGGSQPGVAGRVQGDLGQQQPIGP